MNLIESFLGFVHIYFMFVFNEYDIINFTWKKERINSAEHTYTK